MVSWLTALVSQLKNEKDTERDFFMDAQAAIKYGLADKVLEKGKDGD